MDERIHKLAQADLLGVDIETKDPNLIDLGPGMYRKDGYITGVSFSDGETSLYLDVAHPDTTERTASENWYLIRKLLELPCEKVGANIMYDLDWLNSQGVETAGKAHDIQFAEPLLDEYRHSYKLAELAKTYGLQEKANYILEDYCNAHGLKGNPHSHIWEMPAAVVKKYAEIDAYLPVQILKKQREALEQQDLSEIYEIEIGLIPLLLQMRRQGVRIDKPLFKKTAKAVADKLFQLQGELYEWAGHEFNISSSAQLAKLFDAHGIRYPYREPTELMKAKGLPGNPQIDKAFLKELSATNPIAHKILQYRHYDTVVNMFLLPYMDFMVGDRIHGQFHPLRSDEYGAVSGRFSASKPNLQQVSAQQDDDFSDGDPTLQGQIIRRLFIPEEGCMWAKLDYSQVEYRIAAHYAIGPGSDELREKYCNDPHTDYHKRIEELTGFDRRTSKRLNFGASYGMGYQTAAKNFGWSLEEAEMFLEGYHKAAPYLKITRNAVITKAERKGFIFTLLGRRARMHPSRKSHSMYNRLIQGTAADIMKKAMVDGYNKGLFNVLKPHITVHDEIDVSVPDTKEAQEALAELKYTMENCVKLRVPLIADCHVAHNWAEAD